MKSTIVILIASASIVIGGSLFAGKAKDAQQITSEEESASEMLFGYQILSPRAGDATTDLRVETGCDEAEPRKVIVKLGWKVATSPGLEQRVLLTIYKNGLVTGKFESSDALSPEQSSHVLEGLAPGIINYWRVLTLQEDGWVPSETASFKATVCIADYVSPQPHKAQ